MELVTYPFIGRNDELRLLTNAYEAPSSGFIPIYGRRRVGKSELILRFLENRPGLYFVGKTAPAGLQVREFLEEAARLLEEPLLATFPTEGWAAALDAAVSRWRGDGKLILVFDEFQWTAAASPELPSLLQERWDRHWQRSGKVLLILCGSYVGFMEREVLGRHSPLFGRRTAQILLRPFGFREAALFQPGYSRVDQARAYFLCGGVPLYLKRLSDQRSIESHIVAELLDEYAPLYREGDFLLREELREVDVYFAVLTALAAGKATAAEIASASGIEARSLHYYLQQLLDLGYVRRRHPLTEDRPSPKSVRFDLADPLLRFWFRFVFPHTSAVRHQGPRTAFEHLIKPHLDAYFGLCFERLCQEALPGLYVREGVTAAFEVGEFWSKETQIDVVGLRQDGWTDLGECKWGPVRSPKALEAELTTKLPLYPNRRNATLGRRIFTRKPVPAAARAAAAPAARWHDLEELYR